LPAGIFLNADHVGSARPAMQKPSQMRKEPFISEQPDSDADESDGF
jgi:hypothetical protein